MFRWAAVDDDAAAAAAVTRHQYSCFRLAGIFRAEKDPQIWDLSSLKT